MKPYISVVVPVYNVKTHLRRCIDSLVDQNFDSYEIILVDDGSTDESGQTCDTYANLHDNISVIHKPNGGLSSARLAGFNASKGDYICFIDSDDYVSSSILKDWFNAITLNGSDVAICSYFNVTDKLTSPLKLPFAQEVICDIKNDYILPLLGIPNNGIKGCPSFLWLRLFKKQLINPSFFVSEREYYLEDLPFNLLVSEKIKSIAIVNKPNYFYCENNTSLTKKYRPNAWIMRCNLCDFVVQFCCKNNIDNHIPKKRQLINAITFSIKNACKLNNYSLFKNDIREIVNTEKYKEAMKMVGFKDLILNHKVLFTLLKSKSFFIIYLLYK